MALQIKQTFRHASCGTETVRVSTTPDGASAPDPGRDVFCQCCSLWDKVESFRLVDSVGTILPE
jgi:hypothetical protein